MIDYYPTHPDNDKTVASVRVELHQLWLYLIAIFVL